MPNQPSEYGPIYDNILEFFEGDEWSPEKVEDQPALSMKFAGDNGEWTCLATAYDEQERFVFYSILPLTVPEDKRVAAAEFLTRANYGMEIGSFEMDFDAGDVQFRTSIDIEGGDLTPKMIQNIAYTNVVLTDQYLPGLVMVVEGEATPAEAIARVEQQPTEE